MPATAGFLLVVYAFPAVLGCSKRLPEPRSSSPDKTTTATVAVNSACDGLRVHADDLAGILNAPITTVKPVSGDAQSCEFLTATYPAITISLRPGLGRNTLDAWTSGKMPLKVTPLAGVGDAAVWQDSLHEVIARKDGLLCDIQLRGGVGDFAAAPDTLPRAVGALCNKIFAAG